MNNLRNVEISIFPEINKSEIGVLAEVSKSVEGSNISVQQIARLLEVTRLSFSNHRGGNFDCYRAVSYVMGEREIPDKSDEEGLPPKYNKIVENRQRLSSPELLAVAIVNTGGGGYHIGLVVNDHKCRIWGKWGVTNVDIGPESHFAGKKEVEYYKW